MDDQLPRIGPAAASVFIDIHNDNKIHQLIMDTIPYMSGWSVVNNAKPGNEHWVKYRNQTARFFHFQLKDHYFCWTTADEMPSILPKNQKLVSVNSLAQMSRILDHIYEYARNHPKKS